MVVCTERVRTEFVSGRRERRLTVAVLMVDVDAFWVVVVPTTFTVLVTPPTVLNEVWVHLVVCVTVRVGPETSIHFVSSATNHEKRTL